jgi:hypothetical protein
MEKKLVNQNLDSDKLVISYELLQLMDWIVEHESETLKKLITKAIKHGFDDQLKDAKNYKDLYTPEQMQNTIVDFLSLLELLLFEANNEQEVSNIIQKNIMPAIDNVDTKNCDSSTVKASIAVATSKVQRNPKENPQEVFLKELLKRWKPDKDTTLN